MRVQLPDGQIAQFPDDMPPEAIERTIAEQYKDFAPIPEPQTQTSALERFGTQVAESAKRAGATIFAPMARARRELTAPFLGPEEPGAIETKAAEANPVAQAVGGFGGEMAMLVGPAAVGRAAATKVAPRVATRFPRLTQAAGEAAGLGTFAAARAEPGERLEAAAKEAAAVGAGQAIGAGLERTMRGVRRSPQAQTMLDEGTPLTPGQAAQNPAWRWVEERLADVPGLSQATRKLEDKAVRRWNRNLLNQVIPDEAPRQTYRMRGVGIPARRGRGEPVEMSRQFQPGQPSKPRSVTAEGQEGFQQAQAIFSDAYDDLFNRAAKDVTSRPVDIAMFNEKVAATLGKAQARLGKKDYRQLQNFVAARVESLRNNIAPGTLQNFNQKMRDRLVRLTRKGKDDQAEYLDEVLQSFEDLVGEQHSGRLRDLNMRYVDLDTLQNAAARKSAVVSKGMFTPNDLASATIRKGTPRTVSAGRAPMQRETNIALETIGELPGKPDRLNKYAAGALIVGGGYVNPWLTAGTMGAGRLAITEPVRDFMTGGSTLTARQAQLLRSGVGMGAAALQE